MYWKYFLYILTHKWYVLLECWKERLIWQGIVHDISKFFPSEFKPYAKYFFPLEEVSDKTKLEFNYAWLHHQNHNKHHWNYYVMDKYNKVALPMPDAYVREMICDWKAMARNGKDSAYQYYLDNKDKMVLHDHTRQVVELLFNCK